MELQNVYIISGYNYFKFCKKSLLLTGLLKVCLYYFKSKFAIDSSFNLLLIQLSELKKTLNSVQNEVQEALQRASTALSNEQQARRDCQEQVSVALIAGIDK